MIRKNKQIILGMIFIIILCSIFVLRINSKDVVEVNVAIITAQEFCTTFDGDIFKYKEKINDPDYLTFVIIFKCSNNILTGQMFGPYPAGEHGLFYFNEKLSDIQIHNTDISFSINGKTFFSESFTLKNYMEEREQINTGFSRSVTTFQGTYSENSLALKCSSEYSSLECYTPMSMIFNKI